MMHFYAYFGQYSYFKSITHQLKALKINLNERHRINELKFRSIRINVTKYNVTFSINRKGELTTKSPCVYVTGLYYFCFIFLIILLFSASFATCKYFFAIHFFYLWNHLW